MVKSHPSVHSLTHSLGHYLELNRPDSKDTDIQAITDIIADSLFSVFVTAGKTRERYDLIYSSLFLYSPFSPSIPLPLRGCPHY